MAINIDTVKTEIETAIKADTSQANLLLELYNGNNHSTTEGISGLLDVFLVSFPPEAISAFKLSATPKLAASGVAYWLEDKTSPIYTCATNLYKKIDDTALNWANIISEKVIKTIADITAKTIAGIILQNIIDHAEVKNVSVSVPSLSVTGTLTPPTTVNGSTGTGTANQTGSGTIS